ncbi:MULTISPECIES: DNA polymerase IV [Trueperella]|uniref:DNA polymerase IV n=1 Tax=Trueperella bernardiae TaxID=59561 RepID=A0A0W1KL85_9ACTO|nr:MULTISPECIES: DNA polymerase IV [Trueperella]KTF04808.1 DNA polymerase IV [Trueperella bernardiae]MDK8601247.1 DNA polymerase IV [Trueperella bernardiae]OFS65806.1 DNA polymerase IV [Trueperella sp. HMSC08H06]
MSRAPRSRNAKRDWGSDDSRTPILHVDMDAFFVSVELLTKPELVGKPVAVGGQDRGVISAASYEARRYGVNSAMPVARAKRLCPNLIILPHSKGLYGEVSARIMAIFHEFTPRVEPLSVDEAFLDVAGARKIFGSPVAIATEIRRRIYAQEHLTASIGVAATKHVAKIASAQAKPDGLLLIPYDQTVPFLHGLPVGALWGVGDKTREKLDRKGIYTVADLAALGEHRLRGLLGEAAGSQLYTLAMGHDPRAVTPHRKEKSISREQTYFEPLTARAEGERALLELSHDVARRLRAAGFVSWTIGIKLRSAADFSTISRTVTLGAPTALAAEIFDAARRLFDSAGVPDGGIRLLGVRAENLAGIEEGIQLSIGDDGRRGRAEAAMDQVRSRFGAGVLGPASLVERAGEGGGYPRGESAERPGQGI